MERISKTKIAYYASLSRKKIREKERLFCVEGNKSVLDILDGPYDLKSLIATQSWIIDHSDIADKYREFILEASDSDMKKISSLSTPPDVIAVFYLPTSYDDIQPISSDSLTLVLDGIQDPGNLGTIIRTADWYGIHTIYASRDTVDVFNPKVVMATMGSLRRVKIIYCDLVQLLSSTKGIPVYGTLLDGENIYDANLSNKSIVIMGNEGNGISPQVRKFITSPILIPPADPENHPESLNVGIATAITLSEIMRNSLK